MINSRLYMVGFFFDFDFVLSVSFYFSIGFLICSLDFEFCMYRLCESDEISECLYRNTEFALEFGSMIG